jgi:DNA replicative helicase MCM subunit Mcm2 (Cdc46/Mcm family)
MQWRALKLSGALAILSLSDTITTTHLADAINIIELLSSDLQQFEIELEKERGR